MPKLVSGTSTQNFSPDVKHKHFPIPTLRKTAPKIDKKKPADVVAKGKRKRK